MDKHYSIEDLKDIMAQLRNPDGGCPWDLKQNFKTIAPYTIEEAYEVVDAIDKYENGGEIDEIKDELGDLLFQVIFHAQLASEKQAFGFDDVVQVISEKLVRRHPHVFGDEALYSDDEIREMWERVKADERALKTASSDDGTEDDRPSLLSDVPVGLPGLSRAVKLQKKAARVGFDWPSLMPVVEKLEEELLEVKEALFDFEKLQNEESNNHSKHTSLDAGRAKVEEELGDLMFVMANVARHLRVDPEKAVRLANLKFCRRFAYIEQELYAAGRSPDDATLEEMDALWDEAKLNEK